MLGKINWKYALGEILIVILGISIAFSLNRWAENSKSKKEQIKYLQNLVKDLEADTVTLDSNIITLKQRVKDIVTIRKYTYVPNPRMDTVLTKFYNLSLPINFRPRNITYQTLINSGDFKLIDDFDLKTSIQEHYLKYDEVLEIYKRQDIITDKYVGDYFMNKLDFRDIYENKNYSFMKSNYFSNMMGAQRTTFTIKAQISEEAKASCKKLMNTIDQKLK